MWVEEMKSMNDKCPVILYKPQGTIQPSESNNLSTFVIEICTCNKNSITSKHNEEVWWNGYLCGWDTQNKWVKHHAHYCHGS